jgi:hypothetical protein
VSQFQWLIILSDQLPIAGLVGRYLTNYLMGRRPIFRHPCGLLTTVTMQCRCIIEY